MDVDLMVGRQVRLSRSRLGWSLQTLSARLAEVGVPMSVATLSRVESGRGAGPDTSTPRPVTVRELLALAVALEVPPPHLVTPVPLPQPGKNGGQPQDQQWEPIELAPDRPGLHPMMGLQWFLGLDEPTTVERRPVLSDANPTSTMALPYEAWVRLWIAQQAFDRARRDLESVTKAYGQAPWADDEAMTLAKGWVYAYAREYERAARDLAGCGVEAPLLDDERLALVAAALNRKGDYLTWKAELAPTTTTENDR
jgi:transcriptional regulator with XRE-family HTH domain